MEGTDMLFLGTNKLVEGNDLLLEGNDQFFLEPHLLKDKLHVK